MKSGGPDPAGGAEGGGERLAPQRVQPPPFLCEPLGRLASTELFLARLQQINPDVETAYINPVDFTTRSKVRNEPDKAFPVCSVTGSPKIIINVGALLSLRDLGRVESAVRVPPLLIIDSPLADLGAVDRATRDRLIDTPIDVASDASSDGYACQVIAATNDPLPRSYSGAREIPVATTHRFFDHAPRSTV
ncbi:hypothetical protein ABZ565_33545 [Streptomyces sp. NPDC016469]|uniref:hypothetical protein n=1 Tax=Streptomyces sp. NPDC016469 TaxID=3157191 RepID=UPI0033E5F189